MRHTGPLRGRSKTLETPIFLQCVTWEPGHSSSEQVTARQKPSKTLVKPRIPACRAHGGLGGRLVASRGGRWISQGDMQKPLEKLWFSVGAPVFPGGPVPSRSELVRAGHSSPKTCKIHWKTNNSTHVLLTDIAENIARPLGKQAKITPRGTPQLVLPGL